MIEPKKEILKKDLIQEIRLNRDYASLLYSEYSPDELKKESIPIIKRKTVLASDYLQRLTSSSLKNTITPPNCRYIEELDSGYIVIIEEPPAYRTIKSSMSVNRELNDLEKNNKLDLYGYTDWKTKNSSPYHFTLAFPYVIFMFYINHYNEVAAGQVFVRTQQMTGLSDYLLKIPMCNISDSGLVCFGDAINKRCQSLTATIQHAIMVWWSATFNTDYTYNYAAYKNISILNSYLEWQYMSQANPMFIYNADWIKMKRTIGESINRLKEIYSLRAKKTMGYKQLADMFNKTHDTGIEIKVTKRSRKKAKLFFDIAQGMYINDEININVGDSFKTKSGKIAFISSFIGFPDGSDVKYIQIDVNGHLSMMKLTNNCRKFLAVKITEQRRVNQITLANKTIITPGIILKVIQGGFESYKKVDYIRKSHGIDGDVFEVKMGNDYYLSSSLNAVEFELDKLEINGVILNKNDQYVIINNHKQEGAKINGCLMNFKSIDVRNNQIVARFKNDNGTFKGRSRTIELSKSYDSKKIFNAKDEDVKHLEGIFRIGRKLFIMPGSFDRHSALNASWGINGTVVYENQHSMNLINGKYTKYLIKDDRFFIEGADFNTEFHIGDKIVVADWKNPLDVLTVKELNGFKYDETDGDIYFIMSDKAGTLSESKYVDGKNGVIKTGKIRRVTNKIGDLSAGTKIIAETAGIPCFPKKDANIIVAFIIDTGREPLVLCSNGCTLWYNDVIDNFKKIALKSKTWANFDHAPLDLSKIKLQAGDIINGIKDYDNNHGYLLFNPSSTRALRAMPLEYFDKYPESYTFDQYMIRGCNLDCIPAPRIPPTKIEEAGTIRGVFNMHSYDVFENQCITTYLNQRR